MSLSVGIVGLPNSGKSTLFNALLSRQIAQVAEYPFTTIEPNTGVVEVPDERLEKLVQLISREAGSRSAGKPDPSTSLRTAEPKVFPAAIKFVDIAGLVKGAHQGEGLGNKFLSHIREVDAIIHVLRVFENPNVSHVHGKIDPQEDAEIVKVELELAEIKKPTIYVLNVDEGQLQNKEEIVKKIELEGEVIIICAKLEADLADLSDDEKKEYLAEVGVKESGLDKLIKAAYKLLDLITFFTIKGGKQVQAWPIKQDSTAIEAAEMVHTDFARGFVKTEVISFSELEEAGSWRKAQELGKTRIEGREYVVKDGDVVEFKFSV
jgi:small GTP-binding protein